MKISSSVKVIVFALILAISGCAHLPKPRLIWPDSEKIEQIQQLKKEQAELTASITAKIEAAKQEIVNSEKERYSKGTAEVYAAESTLDADPNPNKFNVAAGKALDVAKEALPTPTVEDLIEANRIQAQLLSEQASVIKEADAQLAKIKEDIIKAKNEEEKLKQNQETLRAELENKKVEADKAIAAKEAELEKERLTWATKADQDAAKWREENSWKNKLNPFHGIMKSVSSIFYLFIILGVGAILIKLASIFFPGVNFIQMIVSGIGRVVGGIFRGLFKLIPNSLEGLGAVPKEDYDKERQLANNAIGSIQEFKDEYKTDYETKLKGKLQDWFKDTDPILIKMVDARIKELNLK